MIFLRFRFFLISSLCLALALSVSACKKGDESQSGVTGRVTAAEGNGGGAIVRLYPAPSPFNDVSVWSVPNRVSSVGFGYDLHFGYDHRTASSAYVDTADGDGSFRFENVTVGDYVVVAEKPNQGWTPYRLLRVSGDVSVGDLQLPRVVTLTTVNGANIASDQTWSSGTHYILADNTFVREGATLTIEPGAIVRIAGNKALNILDGTLVCRGTPDRFIIFTAADVVSRDPDEWLRVRLSASASPPDFAYTAFKFGATAISSDVNGGIVEFCSFDRFVNEGVLALRQPPTVRNCVFNRVATGVRAAYTSGFLCERNVFQTCDPFAIVLDTVDDGEVFCNWFRDCGGSDTSGSVDRGVISMDWVTNFEIRNNHFETSWYALAIGSRVDSTVRVHHNIFERINRVADIGVTEERRSASYPKFNYNCFRNISLRVIFVHCNAHNNRDVDATRNFWGTTSISTIHQSFVNDRNDDPICPSVYVEPVLPSCEAVQSETGIPAGICP